MANEPVVTEAPAAEDEYRKPNPQENPRNIALAEIAKAVDKKHMIEFAETADSIDDEGNIIPASPPEAAAPAEETPAIEAGGVVTPPVVAAPPVEVVPAAPAAIDPAAEYDVVVDGQKMKVKGAAIIDAGYRTFQKETAADFRLKMASELLKEAEVKARGPTPQGAVPSEPPPAGKTDAE